MAVPKKKKSKSKSKTRKNNKNILLNKLNINKKNEVHIYHHISSSGFYKNDQVIENKKKAKKEK